jgi:3-hydroxyacyl-CoA dehydrogenase
MQTSETVTLSVEGRIALITIDNPPVNAASASVRKGLAAAVDALPGTGADAAALYALGRTFVAGADIREFGTPPADPWLPEVCQKIEDSPVPIVCILHGTTLGGGLEIALACHGRLALLGTRVGLPEAHLGIIPGAGGTQRLPRLTGQAFAVEAITTGRHVPLNEALEHHIVDAVAPEASPADAARAGAIAVAEGRLKTRRTGSLSAQEDPGVLEAARARIREKTPNLVSPLKAIDAIAAASRPIAQGLATERALYDACMDTPQRAGLIHAFFAERAVARMPEAAVTPRSIDRIGVLGAGTMGTGIAAACLIAGLPVTLIDEDTEALTRAGHAIDGILTGAAKRGKLSDADAAKALLVTASMPDRLAEADVIIEAAFEDLEVKRQIFSQLDRIARPGAVLATNTSYLDVNAIAASTGRPEDVLGLHFFSPAHIMRLIELVVAEKTAPDAAATGLALAKRLKKVAVRSGVCDGFIGNRILRATRYAAEAMVLYGTPFTAVDDALETAGWALGPFRTADLAGLDIAWAQRKRRAALPPMGSHTLDLPDRLCKAGLFGRKTAGGYYLDDGRPNPKALEWLDEERRSKGITPRPLAGDAITNRFLTAMIMQATRIVEDGTALRPIDVDAVLLFGYGFPRHLGGPMHQADMIGARSLIDRIEAFAKDDPIFWGIPPLLQEMAGTGVSFADRN